MKKLLVVRFSAFGDVAMTVPIIYSLAKQHPEWNIVFLSRESFSPLFQYMPHNVQFMGVNLNDYKGLIGLNRLAKELKKESFDAVADFHNVLRTKFLRFKLAQKGTPFAVLDKGRKDKKRLTRNKNKVLKPLKTTFERYTNVLEKLSIPVTNSSFKTLFKEQGNLSQLPIKKLKKKEPGEKWIGFAPFAKHKGKIYPPELIYRVIKIIEKENRKLILFGGGKEELALFEKWKEKKPTLILAAGQLDLEQELIVMSHLDCMVSMDSANMHLASLVNIPVVSIWGATHPYCGFMGWNQNPSNVIQLDMPCRPCSVFGNKPCYRNDYACLVDINPYTIATKIEKLIK